MHPLLAITILCTGAAAAASQGRDPAEAGNYQAGTTSLCCSQVKLKKQSYCLEMYVHACVVNMRWLYDCSAGLQLWLARDLKQ